MHLNLERSIKYSKPKQNLVRYFIYSKVVLQEQLNNRKTEFPLYLKSMTPVPCPLCKIFLSVLRDNTSSHIPLKDYNMDYRTIMVPEGKAIMSYLSVFEFTFNSKIPDH